MRSPIEEAGKPICLAHKLGNVDFLVGHPVP